MTIDYPDYGTPQANANAINSTGVPLVRNITVLSTTAAVAAGTTSGTFSQAYGPFYEGYLLEVIPQNPGSRIFAADLAITHLDASGNPLAIEQVTVSNWQNIGNDTSVIRGRLLGTSLQVVANVAASGWLNTITGGAVTADAIKVRFAGLQTFVPGTGKRVPIITAASGLLNESSSTASLPGTAGTAVFIGVLPDYTGQVVVSGHTTAGGGFTYAPKLSGFTVSNGTGAVWAQEFPNVVAGTPSFETFALPSTFNIATAVQRSTVAGNAGFNVTITAPDQ